MGYVDFSTLEHLILDEADRMLDMGFIDDINKIIVGEIVRSLNKSGYPSKGISSNLDQSEREEVVRGFRSKRTRILVATDLMSRGIDVKEINLVVNFDVPQDAEDYVHRVGRTARVDAIGEAITLVNPRDMQRFRRIETLIETELPKQQPPTELGEGPQWSTGRSSEGRKGYYHKKKRNFRKGKSGNR